jgi:hypothetical protein
MYILDLKTNNREIGHNVIDQYTCLLIYILVFNILRVTLCILIERHDMTLQLHHILLYF